MPAAMAGGDGLNRRQEKAIRPGKNRHQREASSMKKFTRRTVMQMGAVTGTALATTARLRLARARR